MRKITKVLLVEDDPDILELIADIIKKRGFTVIEASNGEDALELFTRESPDLVMSDVCMPRRDGISLSAAVKFLRPDVPVVLFSGEHPDLAADHFHAKIQCDHVFFKPFVSFDVLEAVRLFM